MENFKLRLTKHDDNVILNTSKAFAQCLLRLKSKDSNITSLNDKPTQTDIGETAQSGLMIDAGSWKPFRDHPPITLQVVLDPISGKEGSEFHFWFGCCTNDKPTIMRLIGLLPDHLKPIEPTIGDDNYDMIASGKWVFESYDSHNQYYLGIWDSHSNFETADVATAAESIMELILFIDNKKM